MSDQGLALRHDPGFGQSVAWDIDLLTGYNHEFLQETVIGANQSSFLWLRLRSGFGKRVASEGAGVLWVQGWQVAAYWQAVWQARSNGLEVWMRGETNLASSSGSAGKPIRSIAMRGLFQRINKFLYIGNSNRSYYKQYGIGEDKLVFAPYCVENQRFSANARDLQQHRASIRRRWGVPEGAFCVLFVGKFIKKKRPLDLVRAARLLRGRGTDLPVHLLFVGSGELLRDIKNECRIIYDAASSGANSADLRGRDGDRPSASIAGFLNQSEIAQAYVAADCLVLPSESTETWGLVVNEAMASGLPCVVSDAVGCSDDLVRPLRPDLCFPLGDHNKLADALAACIANPPSRTALRNAIDRYDVLRTVVAIEALYESTHERDISWG